MTFHARRDIVVVAASAGGIAALQTLAGGLPADLPAAVLVVTHLPAMAGGALPKILQRAGPLPAAFAEDGEAMKYGRIFVAPPNRHLMVAGDALRLSQGPRQHGCRPAADPLFLSAALSGGPRTLGVMLSGTLDDGAVGCAAIERHGGVVLVQDPDEASYDGMPRAALAVTSDARVAGIAEIAEIVAHQAGSEVTRMRSVFDPDTARRVAELLDLPVPRIGDPPGAFSGVTCPECGGPIYCDDQTTPLWFECRIGHSWSARTLLEGQSLNVERALATAARQLEESAMVTRLLAAQATQRGHEFAHQRYERANRATLRALESLREMIIVAGQINTPPPPDGETDTPTA